jgi:hypothetical protein
MSILIKCPALGIESSTPEDFALLLGLAEVSKKERMDLAILSCIAALGGKATMVMLPGINGCQMSSTTGTLVIYVEDSLLKIREEIPK